MLSAALLSLALQAQPAPAAEVPKSAPVAQTPSLKPLAFGSKRLPYKWDTLIPVNLDVDGLKINTIFFNRREFSSGLLKGADFGTRAQVEVTNASKFKKMPGFAVAVFDAEDRLVGVSSNGARVGSHKPDATENYDLNFHFVLERLPLGSYFVISMELGE
jgi:hypothetical protein